MLTRLCVEPWRVSVAYVMYQQQWAKRVTDTTRTSQVGDVKYITRTNRLFFCTLPQGHFHSFMLQRKCAANKNLNLSTLA